MATNQLSANILDLTLDVNDTNLAAPAYSGQTVLTVYSTTGFADNQVLLIGDLGDEMSEIAYTKSSGAISGNTITLQVGLKKDHPADIKIYQILYDRIEFSNAATPTGAKTVISVPYINPEKEETIIVDNTVTSGFLFTRYYNSINASYSNYSDPIPLTGLASNTVGYIIQSAMEDAQKQFTNKLTYDMLIRNINECLRFVRGKLKRWSSSQVFNANLGQADRGKYRLPLPADYYDKNSNRSCLSVRVGNQEHLTYVDKMEFDTLMENVTHTTLTTTANIGAVTLTLENSADLPANGTVTVYVSNVPYAISYTTNDLTTNTLGGIDPGTITVPVPSGTDVWYGLYEGFPEYFTIYDGYLYWWYPTDETITGRTVYMDYWTDITEIDSDTDIIPLSKFDMIKHWLIWSIRTYTERGGKPDFNDPDYQMFTLILNDAIRRETTGQKFKMMPKVSGIKYRRNVNINQSYEEYLRN